MNKLKTLDDIEVKSIVEGDKIRKFAYSDVLKQELGVEWIKELELTKPPLVDFEQKKNDFLIEHLKYIFKVTEEDLK